MLNRVADSMPGYKKRGSQMQMIAEVANTFASARLDPENQPPSGQNISIIEGPTGVGKTFGYLIPALIMARHLKKKLVISTGTVALQEQLANRDIPLLAKYSGLNVDYTIIKGRARYVCKSRLDDFVGTASQGAMFEDAVWDRPPAEEEIRQLTKLSGMVEKFQWDGDRDSLDENITQDLWSRITTDAHGCVGKRCKDFDICGFFKARNRVDTVDVIIANHDLLLSALSLPEGNILPPAEDCLFVIDEAHHLPETTIAHFERAHTLHGAAHWLEKLPSAVSRALAQLPNTPRFAMIPDDSEHLAKRLIELAEAFSASRIFTSVGHVERFPHGIITEEFQIFAEGIFPLAQALASKVAGLKEVITAERQKQPARADLLDGLSADIGFFVGRLEKLRDVWRLMLYTPKGKEPPIAKWVQSIQSGHSVDYMVCTAPFSAARPLAKYFWDKAAAVVLTSATITTLGNFDYFKRRCGLFLFPETTELRLQSPFDFKRQGKLVVPQMKSDPKDVEAHTLELTQLIPSAITSYPSGSLVLFASKKQMNDVFNALPAAFQDRVLVQGHLPRQKLIDLHIARVGKGMPSVLFGLASFGEGLDLPGKLCEHVIIAKLPFSPPTTRSISPWPNG